MTRPWGSAIGPRIPASCFTCPAEPRAPEATMEYTGLNGVRARLAIVAFSTASTVSRHTRVTAWYRCSSVASPRLYIRLIRSTFAWAARTSSSFSGG